MERYTWVRFAGKLTHCHNAHSKVQHSSGAMEEVSGLEQKANTHPISRVVMDIAAFKVSRSVGTDIDATALRAARVRSASIGAMKETSRQGQKASTQFSRG